MALAPLPMLLLAAAAATAAAAVGPPGLPAESQAIVEVPGAGRVRVQCLSASLLRLEAEGPQGFEDRPTFLAHGRSWSGVPITSLQPRSGGGAIVRTAHYEVELSAADASGAGAAGGCAAVLRGPDGDQRWASGAFGGAPATLKAPPPAEVAETTVLAVADAPRFVPPAHGAVPPAEPVPAGLANTSGFDVGNHAADVYLFMASRGYDAMRTEFLRLTGPTPTLPAWAFGLWFCWYHPYSQAEKEAEVQRFLDDGLGLSVVCLDRDWRQFDLPDMNVSGFRYLVNATLFPDMDGFFQFVHDRSLRVFFNDHPKPLRSGATGTSSSDASVVLAPEEVSFRYHGLTSLMARGLDFWWDDCHWRWYEPSLKVPGSGAEVDGVTWGQAVFHDVMARYDGARAPTSNDTVPMGLGCSESPHPAAHRYPVWWTGDIFSTELMPSVAAMIRGGYETFKPYVHPDCTAHHNPDPPEVYVRWIQFCAFGTIMRVHSDPYNDRRPWTLGKDVEDIFRDFVQMRIRLLPTLASASARATAEGEPLVKRLDFLWPEEPSATRLDQFLLGDDTLVAPVDPFPWGSKAAVPPFFNRSRSVWIPPGEWTEAFSGDTLRGPLTIERREVPLTELPLYHRRGAVVVTAAGAARGPADVDWRDLVLQVWPSGREGERSEVFRDTASAWPTVLRTQLLLRQSLGSGASACAGSGASARRVELEVGGEQAEEEEGTEGRLAQRTRRWLVRVHLLKGEAVLCASLDGLRLEARALRQLSPSGRAVPFGGAGSATAGGTLELELEEAPARLPRSLALVVAGASPSLVV